MPPGNKLSGALGHVGLRSRGGRSRRANGSRRFEAVFVPGIPQTGEYARAVISHNVNVPLEEAQERVAARLPRQSLFSRERPARLTF